jgi:hypothetical protein
MEKLRGPHILERGELFLRVWQHQAPQHERFAGIDCQELNAEINAVKEAGGQFYLRGSDEAIKSRYELLLIPAKMAMSGRRTIVKLAVGSTFASFLKQAYQRLEQWLNRTAPQLNLTMGKPPP